MISEGRAGVDDVFSLQNGILKLELGKERYEKTGLMGKPIRSGGRKHAKERFVVEINLRLPSMAHGKKGFERIVWAFKNVLDESISWLLYSSALESTSVNQDCPLEQHHPQIVSCIPVQTVHHDILIPPFDVRGIAESASSEDIQDYCNDLSEWLALVSLGSPRVYPTDVVDTYLSRYEAPHRDIAQLATIRSFKWHGFLPSQWIMGLLITLLRREFAACTTHPNAWFALSCHALGRVAVEAKDGYSILCSGGESSSRSFPGRFICWEYVGAPLCI